VDQLAAAVAKHHGRVNEILHVLGRYGFAEWASRGASIPGVKVVQQLADPTVAALSTGERMRGAATELGTTFIKFGQMLSLRPDLVGTEVATELGKLQAAVAPDPGETVAALIVSELGAPIDALFASFDADALGSGSVAQVHGATMFDGAQVVVKVLHAGVDRTVGEDLELMTACAEFLDRQDPEIARYRPITVVEEFNKMMRGAIDMAQELGNLQLFAKNFASEHDVVIPTPYPERSTRRVLTMTRIVGRTFTDRNALDADGWDVDRLVRRAIAIYLEMIFRDGVFHADPHPGNFLLLPGHRIGILDFGDVGYITAQRRTQLRGLVIGIGTRDVDAVTDIILEMSAAPADVEVIKLRGDIGVWLRSHFLGDIDKLDVGAVLANWTEMMRDHHLQLPADMALLFRVVLELQGLGQGVGIDVSLTELAAPYVHEMLSERFEPKQMARQAAHTARSWQQLIETLPAQVTAALDAVCSGKLAVDIGVRDVDGVVDRLVDGVLTSACLLAATQLVARRAGPTIGGFSVAGLALASGAMVTWRRLASNRPGHQSLVQRARMMVLAAPR
jgi:ubiquinone biosynthesis protein